MKRILTLGTIAALTVMIITALSGTDTGFSLFMNTGIEHTIARAVLIVGLAGIAVTARPRSRLFRTTLGIVSAMVIMFTLIQTLNYNLGLLDTVVYFLGGLLLSIESLETDEAEVEEKSHGRLAHSGRI